MNEEARKELEQIIDDLADLERQLHEIRMTRNEIADETSIIQARTNLDIGMAQDEKGKRLYSNEQLRESAKTLKLAENKRYKELIKQLENLRNEGESITIEHARLQNRKTLLMLELGLTGRDETPF